LFFCVALGLEAVLQLIACKHRSTAPLTAVEVSQVDFRDDGKNVVVHLHVTNGMFEPAYVYLESLETIYDGATHDLKLVMHVVPKPPQGTTLDCHVRVPAFDKIPALGSDDIDIKLPRVRSRVSVAGTPLHVETDPFYEAKRVHVELGWSRKPLELAPLSLRGKCRFEVEKELTALEDGIAAGSWPGSWP
jgi:hypothetical protein